MPDKRTILLAEDERSLRMLVVRSLERAGYRVFSATDGVEAIDFLSKNDVDLVILDIIMPHCDGIQVCQWFRQRSDVPIIMLTALDRTEDVVRGFQSGADDYITKPFTFDELLVRIEAIFRRMRWLEERRRDASLSIGDVTVDPGAHRVLKDGEDVHLTPIEFDLLYYLMSHRGEAISKEDLFTNVWGYEFIAGSNLVEVAVRRLREKIEDVPSHPRYIETVRGVGYRFLGAEAAAGEEEL